MNSADDTGARKLRMVRMLAVTLLVISPIVYLVVAFFLREPFLESEAGVQLMFYILSVVAIVSPALYYPVAKLQVASQAANITGAGGWTSLWANLSIIRLALVESVYIYGLVVFLLTHSFEKMLYFYAVGIFWSLISWPRRAQLEAFLLKRNT